MLTEVADVLAHAARSHIGRIAEENGTSGLGSHFWVFVFLFFIFSNGIVRQSPFDHLVHLFDGKSETCGLKTSVSVSCKHLLVVNSLIEVIPLDHLVCVHHRF